jgi:hypothetical protein
LIIASACRGIGAITRPEDSMLKQQMVLRLNAATDDEAATVWCHMPADSKQPILQLQARLIGRLAKTDPLTQEQQDHDRSKCS